jgi:Protein of unknown function (DUF1475)
LKDYAMTARSGLTLLFSLIFLSLLCWTVYASLQQPVSEWTGLTTPPNHYWTIATLIDAYSGFITFYVWVAYKERRWAPRIAWFIGIMLLGNMAMSAYVLLQLKRLPASRPLSDLLATRNT